MLVQILSCCTLMHVNKRQSCMWLLEIVTFEFVSIYFSYLRCSNTALFEIYFNFQYHLQVIIALFESMVVPFICFEPFR